MRPRIKGDSLSRHSPDSAVRDVPALHPMCVDAALSPLRSNRKVYERVGRKSARSLYRRPPWIGFVRQAELPSSAVGGRNRVQATRFTRSATRAVNRFTFATHTFTR
jgi:hypothetical protein